MMMGCLRHSGNKQEEGNGKIAKVGRTTNDERTERHQNGAAENFQSHQYTAAVHSPAFFRG